MPAVSSWLLRVGALPFLVFGGISFVAPGWSSEQFPWKAGPFLTMTIGGWALGTAGVSVLASHVPLRAQRYPLLIYLVVFSIGQLLVATAFIDRLRLDTPLTYPYLIALSTTGLAAGLALGHWAHHRGQEPDPPARVPAWLAPLVSLFVLAVGGLCLITATAGADGMAARGLVVPEALGLFSIRAFSAFFLAIALASLSLLATRDPRVYDELGQGGLLLLLPITVAALVNIDLFDPTVRPASLIYLGAYVIVGALLGLRVLRRGLA